MPLINLESLDIDQLAGLLTNAQAEMASREKENRKELRAELERRVAAEGYKMSDIFPELGTGASSRARRKRPAKYRDPPQHRPDCGFRGIPITDSGPFRSLIPGANRSPIPELSGQ